MTRSQDHAYWFGDVWWGLFGDVGLWWLNLAPVVSQGKSNAAQVQWGAWMNGAWGRPKWNLGCQISELKLAIQFDRRCFFDAKEAYRFQNLWAKIRSNTSLRLYILFNHKTRYKTHVDSSFLWSKNHWRQSPNARVPSFPTSRDARRTMRPLGNINTKSEGCEFAVWIGCQVYNSTGHCGIWGENGRETMGMSI